MTAADLKTALLCLQTAHFHGKRGKPMPTREQARDLLAELGVPIQVRTTDELDALRPGAVLRDAEGVVCERFEGEWLATGTDEAYQPVLPAWVLDAGEEES